MPVFTGSGRRSSGAAAGCDGPLLAGGRQLATLPAPGLGRAALFGDCRRLPFQLKLLRHATQKINWQTSLARVSCRAPPLLTWTSGGRKHESDDRPWFSLVLRNHMRQGSASGCHLQQGGHGRVGVGGAPFSGGGGNSVSGGESGSCSSSAQGSPAARLTRRIAAAGAPCRWSCSTVPECQFANVSVWIGHSGAFRAACADNAFGHHLYR